MSCSNWKDVIRLLDGDLASGAIAIEALHEIITQDHVQEFLQILLYPSQDTIAYLCNEKLTTRLNAAIILHKLTQKYREIFVELINFAQSDGHIIRVHEIDIQEILQHGQELYNRKEESINIQDIYSENWVGKQRAALRKRLGKESHTSIDAKATKFISLKGMISASDVAVDLTQTSSRMTTCLAEPLDSNETWFVRMIRYLIAGMVHPQWEYRHGHCLGLIAIFQGLNVLDMESQHSLKLPSFLLEDIITTALTLLILERYIDVEGYQDNSLSYFLQFKCETDHDALFLSPVKEVAARLLGMVCTAVGNDDFQFWKNSIEKILSLCYLNDSTLKDQRLSRLSVLQSGFITLKHLIRIPRCLQYLLIDEGRPLFDTIRGGVFETDEDIKTEALRCLLAFHSVDPSFGIMSTLIPSLHPLLLSLSQNFALSDDLIPTISPLIVQVFELFSLARKTDSSDLVLLSSILTFLCHLLQRFSDLFQSATIDQVFSLEKSCRLLLRRIFQFCNTLLESSDWFQDTALLLPVLSNCTQLFIYAIVLPLNFSNNPPLLGFPSFLQQNPLASEITPLVASDQPSELRDYSISVCSITRLLEAYEKKLSQLQVVATTEASVVTACAVLLMNTLKAQNIDLAPSATDESNQLSARELRKRKRDKSITLPPVNKPRSSTKLLSQSEFTFAGVSSALFVPLVRIDAYSEEKGMMFAVALSDALSSSLVQSGDLTTLFSFLLDSLQTSLTGALSSYSEIVIANPPQSTVPIFLIVNEAGSLLECCTPKKKQEVERFCFKICQLKWLSWIAVSITHRFILQTSPSMLDDGIAPLRQFFQFAIDHLSSLQSLDDYDAKILPELHRCQDALVRLHDRFHSQKMMLMPFATCYESLKIPYEFYFYSRIFSDLFLDESHRMLELEQLLMHFYRDVADFDRQHCFSCLRLSKGSPSRTTLVPGYGDWIIHFLVQTGRFESLLLQFLRMLQESPATRGSHFHLTIISIIFLWLRSSKHSSAIIEILVDSGIVEVVFDLVATCSVHLEAKTPQPTTPLVCNIDDEDDVFCTCEHSDARYSELYLKISLFILLHLCDRTNFDPETPLTVSSVHMKVVSKIPTLCHEILQSHLFDNPSPAIAISVLFFQLAHHLRGKILPVYEQWVEVSIEGVGHTGSRYTRKYFALSLRTLVPLASVLLRSLHWSDPLRKKGASTTVNLVGNVFLAQYPLLSERYLLDQNENLADQQESIMKDLIARLDGPGVEENRSLDLSRLLRPYQLRGIEWILHLWSSGLGGVLADEMGLGKTVQTLTAIAVKRSHHAATRPSLVVCPAVLITHWETEIAKYYSPNVLTSVKLASAIDEELHRHSETVLNRGLLSRKDLLLERYVYMQCLEKVLLSLKSHQIVLSSYDLIRKISQQSLSPEEYLSLGVPECKDFNSFVFEVIVADEAHCLRNPHTDTSRAIFSLKGMSRLALTGTPVQNRVEDIWSIMNFCMPEFLGDFSHFNDSILKPIKRAFLDAECSSLNVRETNDREKNLLISAEGLALLRSLHKQVLPFLLRRTKAIALPDLPPKIVKDVYCPLSRRQKLLYGSFQQGLRLSDELLEQELIEYLRGKSSTQSRDTSRVHPFQALASLKKICIHPSLVQMDEVDASKVRVQDSGKLCLLISLLIDQEIVTCSEEVLQELRQIWKTFPELPTFPDPSTHWNAVESDDEDEEEDIEEDSDDEEKEIEQPSRLESSERPSATSENNGESLGRRKKKCLVFAEHRETLNLIERMFRQYFPTLSYILLDGRTVAKKRAEIAMLFNSDQLNSPQVLLLTTSSCGLGLNLSAAEVVIFIEHSWNPFVDLQAMDRVHRLGQTRTVTVLKLLAESTIESRITYLQNLKTLIAEEISIGAEASQQLQSDSTSSPNSASSATNQNIQAAILSSFNHF